MTQKKKRKDKNRKMMKNAELIKKDKKLQNSFHFVSVISGNNIQFRKDKTSQTRAILNE